VIDVNDKADKISEDYSKEAAKTLGIIFAILIISIGVSERALGLTLSAYYRDKDLEMVVGSSGISFSDECWECKERSGSPGAYDLIINARMESQNSGSESQKELFAVNKFSFANQYDQTGFFGDRYVVEDSTVLKTIPARFNFDQNLNSDQFGADPVIDGIILQTNPSRKYCELLSPTLNDNEISIFLSINSAVKNTKGYYPLVNNGTMDFPCGNYLGSMEFFFCASTNISPLLGCTPGVGSDIECAHSFQSSQAILGFPIDYVT
jgi:hypothetical protein